MVGGGSCTDDTLLLSVHATVLWTAQTFPAMQSIGACTEKLRFRYYHQTLTLFCKEGEEAAKIGALFVARCQNQNKVQQKENRALLRTSHISRNQAPSSAEESWAPGFQGCSRRPLRSCAALCHVMAELRDLPSPRSTCSERDLEQIHGLKRGRQPQHCRRKEGRSVLRAGVYFPCEERRGGGALSRLAAAEEEVWFEWRSRPVFRLAIKSCSITRQRVTSR